MGTAASIQAATKENKDNLQQPLKEKFHRFNSLSIQADPNESNKVMQDAECNLFSCRFCDLKLRNESTYLSHIQFCASVTSIRNYQLRSITYRKLSRAEKISIFIHENLAKALHYLQPNGRPKTQKSIFPEFAKDRSTRSSVSRKLRINWYAVFEAIKLNNAIAKSTEALASNYRSSLKRINI